MFKRKVFLKTFVAVFCLAAIGALIWVETDQRFVGTGLGDFASLKHFLKHRARIVYGQFYDWTHFPKKAGSGTGSGSRKINPRWIGTEQELRAFIEARGLSHWLRIGAFENDSIRSSPFAFDYMPYESQQRRQFVAAYGLDRLIEGEPTEWAKLKRLMHWSHQRWNSHFDDPVKKLDSRVIWNYKRKAFSAFDILKLEAPYARIDCGTSSRLFMQVAASLGFLARQVYAGDHAAVEAWSNEFQKWTWMDPYYDVTFIKNGTPLNWVELHKVVEHVDSLWNGKAITSFEDAVLFYRDYGIDLKSDSYDGKAYQGPHDRHSFHFLANHIFGSFFGVHLRNDHLENAYGYHHPRHHKYTKMNIMWLKPGVDYSSFRYDERWQSASVKQRSGSVPKAYQLPLAWQTTRNVEDLYWTLNGTRVYFHVRKMDKQQVNFDVHLDTFTPNFSDFYVSHDGQQWKSRLHHFTWNLSLNRKNTLLVKSRNKFDRFGPVSRIVIHFGENAV